MGKNRPKRDVGENQERLGYSYTQGGLFFPCLNFIFLVHCFVRKEATKKKFRSPSPCLVKDKVDVLLCHSHFSLQIRMGGGANV